MLHENAGDGSCMQSIARERLSAIPAACLTESQTESQKFERWRSCRIAPPAHLLSGGPRRQHLSRHSLRENKLLWKPSCASSSRVRPSKLQMLSSWQPSLKQASHKLWFETICKCILCLAQTSCKLDGTCLQSLPALSCVFKVNFSRYCH